MHNIFYVGFSSLEDVRDPVLYNVELVRRDLLNHLNTRQGERVMDPVYGSIIWDLLFDLSTPNTRSRIEQDLTRVIGTESRVELVSLTVEAIEYGYNAQVTVRYRGLEVVDTFELNFDNRLQRAAVEG